MRTPDATPALAATQVRASPMHRLAHLADALGRFSARFVPSAFAIAVLLTLLSFVLGITWGGATPARVLAGWGDGFWELLTFSMQMALVMFTGYLLALTPPVRRVLEWVAAFAKSPRGAVALMAFASMMFAGLNWGLSLVASAMLVRFIAKRQPDVDYRLLVACAYFGLGATWHAGLSASAPLLVATPGHFLQGKMGLVPIDTTLFSPFNIGLALGAVVLLTALAWMLHPAPERTVRVDPAALVALEAPAVAPAPVPEERGVAAWLDHARVLNLVFGGLGLLWLLQHLVLASLGPEGRAAAAASWDAGAYGEVAWAGVRALRGAWRFLNINLVNFLFLALAVLLHRSPSALLRSSEEAGSVLHGIVLQFPLYAGIYGIFRSTGLTEQLGELFVSLSTRDSFPAIVYLYSGLVNYFVPSGGSKWAIEAPYLLEAATRLGVEPRKVVLAYAWGDMATDLIQPFWALPLLAVAKLEFKDILGFLLLV
ncbi:MAG: TIGR00366 family protein, partial [Myxococcaceae bacterium]|nr:TIGR00366 family protein [Myxococcaceae bacterium]